MKIFLLTALVTSLTLLGPPSLYASPQTPINAVVTVAMLGDLVQTVGGDRVKVTNLMGPGVDPHLYKPTTNDTTQLSRADLIFYVGLNLEGRMISLFERLSQAGKPAIAVGETLPKDHLLTPPDFEGQPDPHLWFDVALWSKTVPAIVSALSKADPEGRAQFEANGAALSQRLAELHAWCLTEAESIPEKNRILVTSHDAFNYFGKAYGFKVVGLQGISTISEAALADVSGLVDFIKQQEVPAIFVETSVNPAAIKRVAEDAKVRIGGELFSDAMGSPGEMKHGFDTGTYEGMVRSNMTTIAQALKPAPAP